MDSSQWKQYQQLLLLIHQQQETIAQLIQDIFSKESAFQPSADLLHECQQLDKLICKQLKMQDKFGVGFSEPQYFYHLPKDSSDAPGK